MEHRHKSFCIISGFFLTLIFILSGCGSAVPDPPRSSGSTRSSTPKVLTPEASGESILGGDPVTVDISHTDQGYVMARYTGNAAKASIQISGPDGITYKYFISPSDSYTAFPLTSGNGTYQIDAYENIVNTSYASLFKETTEVSLENEFLPYLYPSQYVNFSADMQAVKTAQEAVRTAVSDLEAIAGIYHYVIEHITYDQEKAASVQPGYLPDIDSTLETGTGICFDYAALTAAMLRSQRIPTKLEIGYSGEVYHSWISVYTEETGWIDKLIEFSGNAWTRMDPTFAAGNDNNRKILKYIGDGSNYTLQYTR